MTTLDEIRTCSPERLSEISATEVMGWDRVGGWRSTWAPHRDRHDLWLVLEQVPEEKRWRVHEQVEIYTTPDEILRVCLEVLLEPKER
jgi:hypothetical protein